MIPSPDPDRVAEWVCDARQRTVDLVADLDDSQLFGPRLDIVNPLHWEIGHVAWFHELWILRDLLGRDPLRPDADALWDSMAIAHDTRWDLPLPSRAETLTYLADVRDAVAEAVQTEPTDELLYRAQYCVFHEDMHTEAFTYTRQTLGYPAPSFSANGVGAERPGGPCPGDVEVEVRSIMLGAPPDAPFAFDNEMWAHRVALEPFAIARAPVTEREFADFVNDGGYTRRELWSEAGWNWRTAGPVEQPRYWRREEDGSWSRREFDRPVALQPHQPIIHVNWHEAEAYCRWAGRRLPTEAEWEAAAAARPGEHEVPAEKTSFPWGDEEVVPSRANFDWGAMGCVEVGAGADGDSPLGCRQMMGNVWEWTASDFEPFPGFRPDFYKEYSEPWFRTRKVLRGGAWATRSRMLRTTWRNFYEPHRNDVLAGFRTCALGA